MKIASLLLGAILLTYDTRGQLSAGYQLGQAPFAQIGYEIGERWQPEARIYPFGSLENTGVGLALMYDVFHREATDVFLGLGLGYSAVFLDEIQAIIPIGILVRPLADRRFGIRAELDLDIGGWDAALTGTVGVRWVFRRDN